MLEFASVEVHNLQYRVRHEPNSSLLIIEVEFRSEGGITVGLRQTLRHEADEVLRRHMLGLSFHRRRVQQVHVQVYPEHWAKGRLSNIFDTYFKNNVVSWLPYRSLTTLDDGVNSRATRSTELEEWRTNPRNPCSEPFPRSRRSIDQTRLRSYVRKCSNGWLMSRTR